MRQLVALALAALAFPAAAQAAGAPIGGVVPVRGALQATPTAPTTGKPAAVDYHGGPVLRTNTVYTIYWAASGSTVSAGYHALIDGYFQHVAAASGATDNVYSTLGEYFGADGQPVTGQTTFGGSYVDTTSPIGSTCSWVYAMPVSGCVTMEEEQTEIGNAIDAAGWTVTPTTIFMLFTPQNVGSCTYSLYGGCAYIQYCGYHSTFVRDGADVRWGNFPYPTAPPGATGSCDLGTHPNGDVADAAINVVSHEHIETITDPDVRTGWWDDDTGEELSDKCAWKFGLPIGQTADDDYNQSIAGGKYWVQQEWTNASSSCVQRPPDPAPAAIASFWPETGTVGATVFISGAHLGDVKAVKFGGADAQFTQAGTMLAATVPAGATYAKIALRLQGGGSVQSTRLFKPLATVDGFSPATVQAGDRVTITGTGLTSAEHALFSSHDDPDAFYESEATLVSDGELNAAVPDYAVTGRVGVESPGGFGLGTGILHIRPTVDPLTVTSGITGSTLTLTGKTLEDITAVTLGANDTPARYEAGQKFTLKVTVPATAVSGTITVTNADGSDTTPNSFQIVPSVSSMSATSGVAGTQVTLGGTSLADASAVDFNGAPAPIVSSSANELVTTVPPEATTGPINVTTPNGQVSSATFKPIPKLTQASPSPARAGGAVAITGTNLGGATALTLGGSALPRTPVSATEIDTTLPAGATAGSLVVTTPGGVSGGLALGVRPTILSISPASGKVGTAVTITGLTLKSPSKVTFGDPSATATVTSSSPTQLVVSVPATAVSGPITVANASGTAASAAFTVLPRLASMSPSSGVAGALVTITGSGLGGATVSFNGVSAPTSTSTTTKLVTAVPPTATAGPVTVTTAAGPLAAGTFKPLPKLTLAAPSPAQALDAVTITGTNLLGATALKLGPTSLPRTTVTATSIVTALPPGATTGSLVATTAAGTSAGLILGVRPTLNALVTTTGAPGTTLTITGKTLTGTKKVTFGSPTATASFGPVSSTSVKVTVPSSAITGPITITNAGGATTTAETFTVLPKVTGFSPSSGPVGKVVKVTGGGLAGATGVTFGGVAATSVTPVSATEVDAAVPAGAATGTIGVTTQAGSALSKGTFKVTATLTAYSVGMARSTRAG